MWSPKPTSIEKLSSFRAIIVGGEPAEISTLEKCLEMNFNVFICYGMTETCSGIAGFWIKDYPDALSSVGQPFNGVTVSIINNYIGIASKDRSIGFFDDVSISNSIIGLSSYVKNWRYGVPGIIEIKKKKFFKNQNNEKLEFSNNLNLRQEDYFKKLYW